MKFICLLMSVIVFVGCDSKNNEPIARNNPSSLRAVGQASDLDLALAAVLDPTVSPLKPAKSCPDEIAGSLRAFNAECGGVRVPADHRVATGQAFAIGYLKVPKIYDFTKPLLVLEQGGPGGSSMMLAAMYLSLHPELAQKFNILAVEQRGTQWTQPLATCPEVSDVDKKILEQTLTGEQASIAMLNANEKCLQRANNKIDIAKISTYQIAKDIVYIASELGFDVFNYYGVSYGTLVGKYLVEYSSKHLTNVVLDSPVVPGKLWMMDAIQNTDNLAATKFEAFRSKHLINLTVEEAIDYFKNAAEVFRKKPLKVPVTMGAEKVNVIVDGDFFMGLLFQMLIMYPDDAVVKMLLDSAYSAKTNPEQAKLVFGFLLPQLQLLGQNVTSIMYQSIVCREFSFAQLDGAQAVKDWTFMPKLMGEEVKEQYSGVSGLCYLNIPKSDEDVILTSPITSNKPILVVGGEFDYVTNPKYVSEISQFMPNAHNSIFKDASHGVFVSQKCITSSITDYLLSPNGQYLNQCIN